MPTLRCDGVMQQKMPDRGLEAPQEGVWQEAQGGYPLRDGQADVQSRHGRGCGLS